jgi:hypothetical protein
MDVSLKASGTPTQVSEDLGKQVKALQKQAESSGRTGTWPTLAAIRDYAREDLKKLPTERTVAQEDGTKQTVPIVYDVALDIRWTVTPIDPPAAPSLPSAPAPSFVIPAKSTAAAAESK